MKVSLNLAQNFSNVDLKSIPPDELLKRIGTQLGAVEELLFGRQSSRASWLQRLWSAKSTQMPTS